MGGIKPRGGNNGKEVARSCSRHPPCIVVAVIFYGMMSMYWCCWLSNESGCCSVSPKEETPRNPAIGGACGLWQARDPCAIRRAIRPCPIPCHLTPRPGHRTTTRFKRQPAAPIHAHHSIAKDSDHNAGNGETASNKALTRPILTPDASLDFVIVPLLHPAKIHMLRSCQDPHAQQPIQTTAGSTSSDTMQETDRDGETKQDPQLLRSRGPEGELRNRPTSAPEVVMAIFTPFTGLTGAHEPY